MYSYADQLKGRETPSAKSSATQDKSTKLFEKEEVFNAFTAFCDDIINQQIEIKKEILNYFLKQENNEYPIIEKYRLKYLNSYFNFD